MDLIKLVEQDQIRTDLPVFKPGDTITVHYKIVEGEKVRVQLFKGPCIAMSGAGLSRTFTVRKISNGVGVERIFPLHSNSIEKVEVNQFGSVRRAKLFYLRGKSGKQARIKEKRR
jgi:large subunit ribosomal protein L19